MKNFIVVLTLVALCTVPIVARADWDPSYPWTKYVQWPDPDGWDIKVTPPKVLADDFPCDKEGWITDIHFWGSWKGDMIGNITSVHLSIHDDLVGACPSQPGLLRWDKEFTEGQFEVIEWPYDDPNPDERQGWFDPNIWEYIPDDHDNMYLVNIFLCEDQRFWQEGMVEDPSNPGQFIPSIYWLDVQVKVADPVITDFGWKTAIEQWRDDAVWRDEYWEPEIWEKLEDPSGVSLDMAFVITTIPEPGVFVIAGIGLLALLRCRKR